MKNNFLPKAFDIKKSFIINNLFDQKQEGIGGSVPPPPGEAMEFMDASPMIFMDGTSIEFMSE